MQGEDGVPARMPKGRNPPQGVNRSESVPKKSPRVNETNSSEPANSGRAIGRTKSKPELPIHSLTQSVQIILLSLISLYKIQSYPFTVLDKYNTRKLLSRKLFGKLGVVKILIKIRKNFRACTILRHIICERAKVAKEANAEQK